ncbi:MAG: CbiX/SirB N-terminal domain-containing protein [Verrucomicrobiota bacterium]
MSRPSLSKAALLIAGHGSTVNSDSSTPTHQHAWTIRKKNLFAEVHECFWKEEPNFRQILPQIEAETVYIVPNFISSGYFTEQVIPRELELDGPITRRGSKTLYYCEPVGLHESMTQVLLHRAEEVVKSSTQSLRSLQQTCLFIFGHGTNLNENSTKIIEHQVELIRQLGIYGECQSAYMEEAPLVKEWTSLTSMPDVVAVPFFISDGLHSFIDIPVLLGLTEEGKSIPTSNPHPIANRRLWYANAIGTEPLIADLILAQVQKFNETYRIS